MNQKITRLPFPTADSSSRAQALVYEGARRGLSVPQVLEQALKQQINQLDDSGCILLLLTLQQLVDDPATSQHAQTSPAAKRPGHESGPATQ